MTKFLKENWFVAVIAAFFVVASIWFAYDTNASKLPSKTVNGKDVVFSVDDKNYFADDYYNELYKSYGKSLLFLSFYEAVIDENIELTSELKSSIQQNIESTIYYYQNYYGYNESYLDQIASYYYGYPTFREYVEYSMKAEQLYSSYIESHATELVTDEFLKLHNPRMISYCLIKMEDPSNPTEDDLTRLEAAKTAWASEEYTAENFADFAKKYSEDSSTASGGGVLGYVDDNSSLVDAFLNAALKLESGEVSEWVFDTNYGYFLIKCDSTNFDDYKSDANFISTVLSDNEGLSNQIVWEAAQASGVTFADDSIKEYVLQQLGVESDGE